MNATPPTFLSCDWGTTAFRLRLVFADGFKIIAEESSKEGNAAVNEEWKKTAQPESGRLSYYLAILQQSIKALEVKTGDVLDGIPLIISGMASSTIGMKELPYKEAPFALDGSDLKTEWITGTGIFPHDTLLISGVKTADDVMRGEEVQVVGCKISNTPEEQIIIHPGTHSKHITVKDGRAIAFATYMTGELFALISAKSILAASIAHNRDYEKAANKQAFAQGVKDGSAHNLLHALFLIRTSDLFKQRTKEEAHHYLSGLLIGSELGTFSKSYSGNIILAGEHGLVTQYKEALHLLGISDSADLIIKDAVGITLKGQFAVYTQQKDSDHASR